MQIIIISDYFMKEFVKTFEWTAVGDSSIEDCTGKKRHKNKSSVSLQMNQKAYTPIHCVKSSASNGDLLEYNGSQGANELDETAKIKL